MFGRKKCHENEIMKKDRFGFFHHKDSHDPKENITFMIFRIRNQRTQNIRMFLFEFFSFSTKHQYSIVIIAIVEIRLT